MKYTISGEKTEEFSGTLEDAIERAYEIGGTPGKQLWSEDDHEKHPRRLPPQPDRPAANIDTDRGRDDPHFAESQSVSCDTRKSVRDDRRDDSADKSVSGVVERFRALNRHNMSL